MPSKEYIPFFCLYIFLNMLSKYILRKYTTVHMKLNKNEIMDTKPSLIYRMEYEMNNVHLYKYEMRWSDWENWWGYLLFHMFIPIINVVILKYQYTKVDYFFKSISLDDFYVELGDRDLGTYFEDENRKQQEIKTEEGKVLTKMEELNRTFEENFTGSF